MKKTSILQNHMASNATWKEWCSLLFVLLVTSIILLRRIGDPSLRFSDADRLLMDGVFILDFLRELPLTHIYDFTVNYYAQYPALSIGYRPPFFPFVEALFNWAFGINMWSSRLGILAFALLGVTAWFKLVRRVYETELALWCSLLLVTTPFVAMWGWYTMTELPVLALAMLTAYVFYRFTETQRAGYLYAAAMLLSLAVWTKQTAIFLSVWFFLYLTIKGQLLNCLKRKETWISLSIIVLLLTPLGLITFWLGDQNITNTVGVQGTPWGPVTILGWDNLRKLLAQLATFHLTLPVLILSLTGIGLAAWKRDPRSLYFLLLALSTYIFFSCVIYKDPRYPIFWIPAFSLFAAVPLVYLQYTKALSIVSRIILVSIALYQINLVYETVPTHASGYDEAAQFVLRESNAPTVFFDGYNNGYFIYFMRAFDLERSMIVLRGDKLLSSSSIMPKHLLKIHAHSHRDIENMIEQYGATHIVVESEDRSGITIHQELRRFLQSGPFRLAKEIPIQSNHPLLEGQTLKIYEYLSPKSLTAGRLELRLPVVGQTLNIPIPRGRFGSSNGDQTKSR